jgi:hypothetical protein
MWVKLLHSTENISYKAESVQLAVIQVSLSEIYNMDICNFLYSS